MSAAYAETGCGDCNGTGLVFVRRIGGGDPAPVGCRTCHGTGDVTAGTADRLVLVPEPPEECPACKGVGAIQHGTRNPELIVDCWVCCGTGTRSQT